MEEENRAISLAIADKTYDEERESNRESDRESDRESVRDIDGEFNLGYNKFDDQEEANILDNFQDKDQVDQEDQESDRESLGYDYPDYDDEEDDDNDEEYDDNNEEVEIRNREKEQDLWQDLANFATEKNVPHNTTDALLKVLNKHNIPGRVSIHQARV